MPIAITQIEPAWTTRLAMLYVVRNLSLSEANTTKRKTRPRMAGREPMSPPRRRLR